MLKYKPDRRGTAELNGYTAKRLNEMALSLSSLARSFDGEAGSGRGLGREEGLTALRTAADLVCGSCSRCNIYKDSTKEDSYFLSYLLGAFSQKGRVDREDMPQLFLETCGQSAEYIEQINRSLGRATMNLAWKNRFLESRETVIAPVFVDVPGDSNMVPLRRAAEDAWAVPVEGESGEALPETKHGTRRPEDTGAVSR